MLRRLAVSCTIVIAAIGVLSMAAHQTGRAPARPYAIAPNESTSCLNVPVSSLIVAPTSCWITGPTSIVVAGTDPRNSRDGVVVLVEQQRRLVTNLPGGGSLHIASISGGRACVTTAPGAALGIDLASGAVSRSCDGPVSKTNAIQLSAATTATPSAAPPPSTSYYVDASNIDLCGPSATTSCPLFEDGAITPVPASGAMTIIDLGAPCFDPSTLVYGSQLFNSQSCVPDSELVTLVLSWVRGYETNPDRSTTTPFVVAVGTSNSLTAAVPGFALTPAQMAVHGKAWFTSVVAHVASAVAGLSAPITVWSGSDIEESSSGDWYDAAPTRAWMDAYSAAASAQKPCAASTTGLNVDYGDYVPNEPGWSPGDVYHVAWEAAAACPVPEIYYSANAGEWQSLSQWATGAGHPPINFTGVLSEGGLGGTLSASGSWNALQSATGQSAPYLSVIGSVASSAAQAPDAPNGVTAVAGAASATVSWSAPFWDGGAKITRYDVAATHLGAVVKTVTLSGWPVPRTTIVSGLNNGFVYTFTVTAANAVGMGLPSTPSGAITPSALLPFSTESTSQYHLKGSDGTTWTDVDAQALSISVQPSADAQAVITGNADLWTDTPGVNQDVGVSVNGAIAGWKESGGYAGAFSPNAATLHVVIPVIAGTNYTIKLVWKSNKPAGAGTIYAGAGPIGGAYSPTRLSVQLVPVSANIATAAITTQPSLTGSNGAAWQDLDAQHLAFVYTAPASGTLILTGNADLWTAAAGYNQDVGIAVGGTVVAWKESGGLSGTFSPNAALVQAAIPVIGGSQYAIALKWKTNRNAPGATIYAGAGPLAGQFSPTRLSARFVTGSISTAVSSSQYTNTSSDGVTWTPIDQATLTLPATAGCLATISASADLWTASGGDNQDIAIAITSLDALAYPNGIVFWKESGGSSKFSPNAAFAQTVIGLPSGGSYTVTLLWKANRPAVGQAIYAAAGSSGAYSPTSLMIELSC